MTTKLQMKGFIKLTPRDTSRLDGSYDYVMVRASSIIAMYPISVDALLETPAFTRVWLLNSTTVAIEAIETIDEIFDLMAEE